MSERRRKLIKDDNGKKRLISSEPRIALFFKRRDPVLIDKDVHAFVVQWMEDLGRTVRDRDYIVSLTALRISNVLSSIPLSIIRQWLNRGKLPPLITLLLQQLPAFGE